MKISKANFNFFVEQVRLWRDKYGITDWGLDVSDDADDGTSAQCWGERCARQAGISISDDWEAQPSKRKISQLAHHEAAELLLLDFTILAEDRFTTKDALECSRHTVINRLEQLVWKNDKGTPK